MCRALVGLLLMLLGYIFHVLHNVMRLLFRLLVLLRYLPRYLSSGVRKKKKKERKIRGLRVPGAVQCGQSCPCPFSLAHHSHPKCLQNDGTHLTQDPSYPCSCICDHGSAVSIASDKAAGFAGR